MKKKVVYVIGTRPEIIRSAFIIKQLKADLKIDFRLLHTGQHYDFLLDKVFLDQLKIPSPDINLKVGSGSHVQQISEIMLKSEKFLQKFDPDIACVFGDTNSSLGVALTSIKLGIPVCHIESGIREWEMDLPEEINRRLIDHCASLLFALSESAVKNLKNEKIQGSIFNSGDPQYAVFNYYKKRLPKIDFLKKMGFKNMQYILLTLHRDKNVDSKESLISILKQFNNSLPIVFPVHPRTRKRLEYYNSNYSKIFPNILFVDPLDYLSLIQVLNNSTLIVTDSGGLQKEAFWSGKPCITIRKHTGWVETVDLGVNFLADIYDIKEKINYILKNINKINNKFLKIKNPYYKKNTAEYIVKLIKEF